MYVLARRIAYARLSEPLLPFHDKTRRLLRVERATRLRALQDPTALSSSEPELTTVCAACNVA